MRWNPALSAISIAVAVTLLSTFATAEKSADRVQVGRPIVVQPGEKVGDLVCVACSIRVRGQTTGDVVAVAGSIKVENGGEIAGDTVAVAGSIRLESGAHIGGDVVTVAGRLHRDPEAVIGGDATSMGGAGWMLLIFVVPLLILGGIVALIIWLIQRSRRSAQVPAYPGATPNTRS
jgi:hypothetical protein